MNSSIKGSIAVKGLVAAVNFLVIIVSARYLGISGRGEIAFFITALATVQLFTEIINGPTIVYLSIRLPLRKKLLLSFCWAAMTSLLAYLIFEFYDLKDSALLAICALQFSMSTTCLMILQGYNKIKLYNLLLLLQSLLLICLFLLMIFLTRQDYHSFIYSFFLSWNIPFVVSLLIVLKIAQNDHLFRESYYETFKKMFKKGIESQSGNIISFLNYRLIFYIIAFQNVDKSFLGFVSTGFAIVESVLMIGNGLGTVQYPAISNSTDSTEGKQITLKFLAISFWFALLGLVVMNAIPSSFYNYLFGKDFRDIKTVILILSPGILFLNLQNTICFYFNGKGLYLINTIGSLVGLVSFLLLCSVAYSYGTYGLCASVSASYVLLCVYMWYQFKKHSGTSFRELLHYMSVPKKIFLSIVKKA